MSFDWVEYLFLAHQLTGQAVNPTDHEARLRTAVSRAYYAAFCKSRNHLRDREGSRIPHGVEAHQHVRDVFKRSNDRGWRQIGQNLDRLRIDRNKVDYDDSIAGLDAMTCADLVLADKVIAALGRL
ncbi:MAG: hypothetical protein KGL31_13920 [candidate division NC10 bacterium]|nr:hypothetical protein [candidate division NC10 bacterium]